MNLLFALTDKKDITIAQAFLLLKSKGIAIDEIHYIRTNQTEQIQPDVEVFFKLVCPQNHRTPISNGGRIENENEYLVQEEDIFKWYLGAYSPENSNYVFIGGGHKLHSLALQKCAFLFGAEDVFHMFVNVEGGKEPNSIHAVEQALLSKSILYSSLGKEHGWPALKKIIQNKSHNFENLREIVSKIGSRTIEQSNSYPFESMNLLPSLAIKWLQQPLLPSDKEWIFALPKTELHCHLGGFAIDGQELEIVREAANTDSKIKPKKDIEFPENWPDPQVIVSLDKYMSLGDNNGSSILTNSGCLKKQIELLYAHLIEQNIVYAEIRCSPFNYVTEDQSGGEVLHFIIQCFNECMSAFKNLSENWCHVNLIIIATRIPDGSNEKIKKHLQLAITSESVSKKEGRCKVVGVDLAGYEDKSTRAGYYTTDFEPIHKAGIALTIHAGENDDSDGIWDAVFKLNTRRIGHALHLFQDKNLIRSIVNREIGIEMCPYANYQIKGYLPMKSNPNTYPLLEYLKAGAKVTVNTDNIGISKASLTDNFMLLQKMNPEITRLQILEIIRNGLDQAFIEPELRNRLLILFNSKVFEICLNLS